MYVLKFVKKNMNNIFYIFLITVITMILLKKYKLEGFESLPSSYDAVAHDSDKHEFMFFKNGKYWEKNYKDDTLKGPYDIKDKFGKGLEKNEELPKNLDCVIYIPDTETYWIFSNKKRNKCWEFDMGTLRCEQHNIDEFEGLFTTKTVNRKKRSQNYLTLNAGCYDNKNNKYWFFFTDPNGVAVCKYKKKGKSVSDQLSTRKEWGKLVWDLRKPEGMDAVVYVPLVSKSSASLAGISVIDCNVAYYYFFKGGKIYKRMQGSDSPCIDVTNRTPDNFYL
jgi:hypothetical protein